jgi:PTS system nitrogen regulatory IIA component
MLSTAASSVSLAALIRLDLIFADLPAASRDEALGDVAKHLAGSIPQGASLAQHLLERELLGSTGVGHGVAIPHCKLTGLRHGIVAVARLRDGVEYGAIDGLPVRILFVVVSPYEAPGEHLQIFAAISRWVRGDQHIESLLAAPDREAMYHLLVDESS